MTSPTRDRVSEVLRHVRGDRILDVGCVGRDPTIDTGGGLHERLAERFPRLVPRRLRCNAMVFVLADAHDG